MFSSRRGGVSDAAKQSSAVVNLETDSSDSEVQFLGSNRISEKEDRPREAETRIVIDLTADDVRHSTSPTSALQDVVSRSGLLLTNAQYHALLRNWEEVLALGHSSSRDHVDRVLSYIKSPIHRFRLVAAVENMKKMNSGKNANDSEDAAEKPTHPNKSLSINPAEPSAQSSAVDKASSLASSHPILSFACLFLVELSVETFGVNSILDDIDANNTEGGARSEEPSKRGRGRPSYPLAQDRPPRRTKLGRPPTSSRDLVTAQLRHDDSKPHMERKNVSPGHHHRDGQADAEIGAQEAGSASQNQAQNLGVTSDIDLEPSQVRTRSSSKALQHELFPSDDSDDSAHALPRLERHSKNKQPRDKNSLLDPQTHQGGGAGQSARTKRGRGRSRTPKISNASCYDQQSIQERGRRILDMQRFIKTAGNTEKNGLMEIADSSPDAAEGATVDDESGAEAALPFTVVLGGRNQPDPAKSNVGNLAEKPTIPMKARSRRTNTQSPVQAVAGATRQATLDDFLSKQAAVASHKSLVGNHAKTLADRRNAVAPVVQTMDTQDVSKKTSLGRPPRTRRKKDAVPVIDTTPGASRTHAISSSKAEESSPDVPTIEKIPASVIEESDHMDDHNQDGDDGDIEFTDEAVLSYEAVETMVKEEIKAYHDAHEYTVAMKIQKQRAVIARYAEQEQKHKIKNPFAGMKAIQFPTGSRAESPQAVRLAEQTAAEASNPKSVYSRQTVEPAVVDHSDIQSMPGYSHFATLKDNILTENTYKLTHFPFRGDHAVSTNDEYEIDLAACYDFNPKVAHVELERNEQVRQYRYYIENLMHRLDITNEVILEYLLAPEDPCPHEPLQMKRELSCNEDFDRDFPTWSEVYTGIKGNSLDTLRRAAWLCSAWRYHTSWSLWHLVKTSKAVNDALEPHRRHFEELRPNDLFEWRCAVCGVIECHSHGEYLEFLDTDDENEFEDLKELAFQKAKNFTPDKKEKKENKKQHPDFIPRSVKLRLPWHIENINGINHRKHVIARPQPCDEKVVNEPKKRKKTAAYWLKNTECWMHENRDPFYPCSHPGPCNAKNCSCVGAGVPCEKACTCPLDCDRRFEGCKCTQEGRPCLKKDGCPCRMLNRECDPDLCGTCGAKEVLMSELKIYPDKCNNIMILRNIPRKTFLVKSDTHGFGLQMGEDVKKGEYIGEYKGEIITKAETDRRSLKFDQQRFVSYIFSLNRKQDLDAHWKGNKMRFINHSNDQKTQNLAPAVMLVNMTQRIGMYAARDIVCGEELFFDYNWTDDKTQGFKNMVVAVKSNKGKGNAKLAKKNNDVITGTVDADDVRSVFGDGEVSDHDDDAAMLERPITPPKEDEDDEDYHGSESEVDEDQMSE